MKKRLNTTRIRRHCSYNVQEICRLFDVHKNTVREWFRKGLPKTDSQRPYLIYGHDLKVFLDSRQKSRRKQCGADEFYCLRCRLPRRAMGALADIEFRGVKTLMLSGLCEICGTSLHKMQSVKALPKILNTFDLPERQRARLSESLPPNLNCDLEKERLR